MVSVFELPIRIPVSRSRWLLTAIGLIHGGAICLPWLTSLPLWIKIVLLTMTLYSLIHTITGHLYLFDDSPAELFLNGRDEWFITTRDNETHEVTLQAQYYVHPKLVVLPFRRGSRNVTIILTPDRINPDSFRRLRVRLRYRKH